MEDDPWAYGADGVQKHTLSAMFSKVRDLLGDMGLSESQLRTFMRTDMFKQCCPDMFRAFQEIEGRGNNKEKTKTQVKFEVTYVVSDEEDEACASKEKDKINASTKDKAKTTVKVKKEREEEESYQKLNGEASSSSSLSTHRVRKVKKKVIEEDDDDDDNEAHHSRSNHAHSQSHHHKKKKHKKIRSSSSESSKVSEEPPPKKVKQEKDEVKPKVHPYYLQGGVAATNKGKIFEQKHEGESSKKKEEKKRKIESSIKPYTYYSRSSALKKRPLRMSPEAEDMGCVPLSVTLVDLSLLTKVRNHYSSLTSNKTRDLLQMEKMKKKEGQRPQQPQTSHKKEVASSSKDKKEKGVSGDWDKKTKRARLEELSREKYNKAPTRKLPWEQKEYFKGESSRPSGKAAGTADQKKKDKVAAVLAKIPKKHAPGTAFQNILQEISLATKDAASKPIVDLKIPKLSQSTYVYRSSTAPSMNELAIEVDRLLRTNSEVDCPSAPRSYSSEGLVEFTIRKMAWWFLKEEAQPPDLVLVHPELHDNELYEDWFDPTKGPLTEADEDIGCVSDPEGTDKLEDEEIRRRKGPPDPDKLDEYCGYTTLAEARVLRHVEGKKDFYKRFIVPKPGTNYDKPNFEAKCYICSSVIIGQRQLGAHIRSEQHKNSLRNVSLELANYQEKTEKVEHKKIFVAKLVGYTAEDSLVPTEPVAREEGEKKSEEGEDVGSASPPQGDGASPQDDTSYQQGPDSPCAVIQEKLDVLAEGAVVVADDDLPSLANFDLEQDKDQLSAKIALRTAGKWTKDMDTRWEQMQAREARYLDEYNDLREKVVANPENHPLKEKEWLQFWDRRAGELEEKGINPDTHDFGSEWVPFWLKRVQEIMKAEAELKLETMKREFGLDAATLKRMCSHYGLFIETADVLTAVAATAGAGASQPLPSPPPEGKKEKTPPKDKEKSKKSPSPIRKIETLVWKPRATKKERKRAEREKQMARCKKRERHDRKERRDSDDRGKSHDREKKRDSRDSGEKRDRRDSGEKRDRRDSGEKRETRDRDRDKKRDDHDQRGKRDNHSHRDKQGNRDSYRDKARSHTRRDSEPAITNGKSGKERDSRKQNEWVQENWETETDSRKQNIWIQEDWETKTEQKIPAKPAANIFLEQQFSFPLSSNNPFPTMAPVTGTTSQDFFNNLTPLSSYLPLPAAVPQNANSAIPSSFHPLANPAFPRYPTPSYNNNPPPNTFSAPSCSLSTALLELTQAQQDLKPLLNKPPKPAPPPPLISTVNTSNLIVLNTNPIMETRTAPPLPPEDIPPPLPEEGENAPYTPADRLSPVSYVTNTSVIMSDADASPVFKKKYQRAGTPEDGELSDISQ